MLTPHTQQLSARCGFCSKPSVRASDPPYAACDDVCSRTKERNQQKSGMSVGLMHAGVEGNAMLTAGRMSTGTYWPNHSLIGWDTFLRTCDKVALRKQRRLPHRRLPENDQTKAIVDQTLAIEA